MRPAAALPRAARKRGATREELPRARILRRRLRDLTVLFNLGWLGFAAREGDHRARRAGAQGARLHATTIWRSSSSGSAAPAPACCRSTASWRRAGRSSCRRRPSITRSCRCSSTPSTRGARCPTATLPPPFAYPERRRRADRPRRRRRTRAPSARAPRGMWPPEGSVSPEAVAAYARAGVGWLATDEGNLWRSLALSDEAHGRGDLYRAWRHAGVDLVFRDRELSDSIGFSYAHGDAARRRRRSAGARARRRRIVDGAGRRAGAGPRLPRRREPLGVLSRARRAVPAHALRRALDGPRAARPRRSASTSPPRRRAASSLALHSGSWIDSDFHIWIGDPVKNRAWELLGRARARFDRAVAEGGDRRRSATPPSSASSPPRAPTGSGGSASRSTRRRTRSSTRCSARTSPAPTPRSACPRRASSTSRSPRSRPLRRRRRHRAARLHPPASSAATASTTGTAPAAIACRAAPPWPTRRWSQPSSSASIDKTLYLRLEPADGRAAELAAARVEVERRRSPVRRPARRAVVDGGHAHRRRRAPAPAPAPTAAPSSSPRPSRSLGRQGPAIGCLSPSGCSPATAPLARYPADGALQLTVPGDEFEAENWSA